MILIEHEIKHGGPDSENGGIWPPGKYQVGERTARDLTARKFTISEGLAQFFIMQRWATDDTGVLRGFGQPKGNPNPAVSPASVVQPGGVSRGRAR